MNGKEFEDFFFGKILKYPYTWPNIPPLLPFGEAIRRAYLEQKQIGWDAESVPIGSPAERLLRSVRKNLQTSDRKALRLYASVGTLLDFRYGTDFFFFLRKKNLEGVVLTADLTTREAEFERDYKVDLVITRLQMQDPAFFPEVGKWVAQQLHWQFKSSYTQRFALT